MVEDKGLIQTRNYLCSSEFQEIKVDVINNFSKFYEIISTVLTAEIKCKKSLSIEYFNNEIIKLKKEKDIDRFLTKVHELYNQGTSENGIELNKYISRSFLIMDDAKSIILFWDVFKSKFKILCKLSNKFESDSFHQEFSYNQLLNDTFLDLDLKENTIFFNDFHSIIDNNSAIKLKKLNFDIWDEELFEYLSEQQFQTCLFFTDGHMNLVDYIITFYGKDKLKVSKDLKYVFYKGEIVKEEMIGINSMLCDTLNIESTIAFLSDFQNEIEDFSFKISQFDSIIFPHNHDNYSIIVEKY
ncbi:hypothetical protein ERX35_011205 [Macrococcus equipercicus]|uniref:Uncharacterized protein n=1 Tax=Macrococcus equipercicus TaxID=69967 RepID=A0ABQ6R610_9STAP|nr:hypothetical protein [Macrococcus equipercicus]KAA1035037.1 hypothetical protein ERX35_011205 [Macrococcus equipercicus]